MSDIKYKRHKTYHKSKQAVIQIKREKLMEDPICQYLEFVSDTVCRIMRIEKDHLFSAHRGNYAVQARYYAVDIISKNTNLKADVMYYFNRDRTVFYHIDIESYKESYINKKLYDECESACTMSEFMRYKQEEGTQLYQ